MSWYEYRPYVPVARRRANAAREMAKLAKKGQTISPVRIEGRKIARTFWGQAWCDHLESHSDFANRLPRGRTYVRNGSVVDLQICPGKVTARVSGSELYAIEIKIKPLSKPRWQSISSQCAGKIASVLELLQGRLSTGVMEIITHRQSGLFPKPDEITLDCSCPDWADMCKHVAAALYGVGARLDEKPELLFVLRQVDHLELIEQAAAGQALTPAATAGQKIIAEADLAEVFGIELDPAGAGTAKPPAEGAAAPAATARSSRRRAKAAAKTGPSALPTSKPPKPTGKAARRQVEAGKAGRRKSPAVKPTGRAGRSSPIARKGSSVRKKREG